MAIMVEAGMEPSQAAQEALWAPERERRWRRFLRCAETILAQPESRREALLTAYRTAAVARHCMRRGTH